MSARLRDFYVYGKENYDKWVLLTEELAKRARGIDFNDSLRCRNAWADLKAEIDRTNFFNEAASGALNLNPHILEKYVA